MNLIKSPFRLLTYGLLALSLVLTAALGCGAASPPAGIPAPVSELMSVSSPDANGDVIVTGDAGAVNGGATVTGNVLGPVGGSLEKLEGLFMGVAYAGVNLTATTIANPDGSFRLGPLTANIGDQIEITQEVDGEVSDPTILTVTGNVIAITPSPKGLGVDGSLQTAYPTSGGASDGFVFSLDWLNGQPLSNPLPSQTFSGLSSLSSIGIDPFLAKGIASAPAQQQVVIFQLGGGSSALGFMATTPLGIGMNPNVSWAAVGIGGSADSVALYDMNGETEFCRFGIEHPGGSVPAHVQTPLVVLRQNAAFNQDYVFAVSQYEDGSWYVTRVNVTACPGATVMAGIPLPNGINPAGLAGFNFENFALISDANSNLVYVADFNSGSLVGAVEVGNIPYGIAVTEQQVPEKAYVVNMGDNSLSRIDLQDFSVMTQTGVGLMPTMVGLFEEYNQAAVLSSTDGSVVRVDLLY